MFELLRFGGFPGVTSVSVCQLFWSRPGVTHPSLGDGDVRGCHCDLAGWLPSFRSGKCHFLKPGPFPYLARMFSWVGSFRSRNQQVAAYHLCDYGGDEGTGCRWWGRSWTMASRISSTHSHLNTAVIPCGPRADPGPPVRIAGVGAWGSASMVSSAGHTNS